MSPLPLITLPAASLRERSRAVEISQIGTYEFQRFLDELAATLKHEKGVGIAAPQVGRNDRVFIVEEKKELVAYINPEITMLSDLNVESEEGCLSVPKTWGIVMRAKKIHMKALDRHARVVEFDAKGFPAIVLQHEFDHLDGILFIDKAVKILEGEGKTRV